MQKEEKIRLFFPEEFRKAGFETGGFVFMDNIGFGCFIQPHKCKRKRFGCRMFAYRFDRFTKVEADYRIMTFYGFVPAKFFTCLLGYRHGTKYIVLPSGRSRWEGL